uniref:Uncharacterized protein n=1 Tax=Sphaerodactylus townsendi TaxID=933632 RepID=A0ACB8FXG1_9SAUR
MVITVESHLFYLLTASCTHVADFDNCLGNANGFCPRGIPCGCKDQVPFCKCPTYHSGWEDYWYMGPKCDQLWSTLDLILLAAVPAVALAVAATVIMQWAGYCRSSAHARHPQVHYRPANVPNPAENSRVISQQKDNKMDESARPVRFPKLPVQSHVYEHTPMPASVGGFSYIPQQALPVERGPPAGYLATWQREIPDVDYDAEDPFSTMQMQHIPVCQAPKAAAEGAEARSLRLAAKRR